MDFKDINPLWRLADPLTVEQAAALIAGFDPGSVCFNPDGSAYFREIETGLTDSLGIADVITAFAALVNAINSGKLKAIIRSDAHRLGWNEWPGDEEEVGEELDESGKPIKNSYVVFKLEPAWEKTTVSRDDLISWLKSKGFNSGFFFPNAQDADSPDYLDPANPRYAPKLAAAVKAWQAVTIPVGKTPKQALLKWLRENAAEFELSNKEGKPNETAIEETAKVANWQSGGPPKTPGG